VEAVAVLPAESDTGELLTRLRPSVPLPVPADAVTVYEEPLFATTPVMAGDPLRPLFASEKLEAETPVTDLLKLTDHATDVLFVGLVPPRVIVAVGTAASFGIAAVVAVETFPAASTTVARAVTVPLASELAPIPVIVTVPAPDVPAAVAGLVVALPSLRVTLTVSVLWELPSRPTPMLTAPTLPALM
jgi:hypothetical protein